MTVHAPDTIAAPMAPGAATMRTPALRYWRVRRALLQKELADHAGVGIRSVIRGESGVPLRLDVIRRLAEALRLQPDQLMDEPPPE